MQLGQYDIAQEHPKLLKCIALCRRYDGDNTGNIDDKEMMQALQELGVLDPKVQGPSHSPPSLQAVCVPTDLSLNMFRLRWPRAYLTCFG